MDQETSAKKSTGCCGKLLKATGEGLLSAIASEQFGSYKPVYLKASPTDKDQNDDPKKDGDQKKPGPFSQFAKAIAEYEDDWGSAKFGNE